MLKFFLTTFLDPRFRGDNNKKIPYRIFICLSTIILLSACSSMVKDGPPHGYVDVSNIPNAVPKKEPRSKYGNPPSYVVFGKRYYTKKSSVGYKAKGIASWYGTKFNGERTSSGEPYNMLGMTAAHKTLPLPTYARVTNLQNGKQVVVKINDRGPFHENRILDLSYAAARKLGITGNGTGLVEVVALNPGQSTKIPNQNPHIPTHNHPKLYLQLGAFSNQQNAYRLEQRLKNISQKPTHIQTSTDKQHMIYRVQIGPLASVDDVDALANNLREKGFGDAMAVVR